MAVSGLTEASAGERLGRRGRQGGAAWLALAAAAALFATSLALRIWAQAGTPQSAELGEWTFAAAWLSFSVVGAVVVARHPGSRVGWMFCATGLLHGLWDVSDYAAAALAAPSGLVVSLEWVSSWLFIPAFTLPALALLRIPDDRLPSPGWGWLWRGGLVAMVVGIATSMTAPLIGDTASPPETWLEILLAAGATISDAALPVLLLGGTASLLVRYRHAERPGRQQLKWLLISVLAVLAAMVVSGLLAELGMEHAVVHAFLNAVTVVALPLGAGLGILRYGLFEVDLVLNRTIVYALASALLAVLYVVGVGLFGVQFEQSTGLLATLVVTSFVAVVIHPLRDRVQAGVDRLMFGERRNPYAVVTRLGEQLEHNRSGDDVLPDVATAVAKALRLPYVSIELREGGDVRPPAVHGTATPHVLKVPLVHAGEQIGALIIGQRSRTEAFTHAERQLFANLARQLGVATQAVRLRRELQDANRQLVAAREEERRRIRRDLHDGLGPSLAGVALSLRAARAAVAADPSRTEELLDSSHHQLSELIAEVRRLVYELRPPTLDELGLVEAVREQAMRLAIHETPGQQIRVNIDGSTVFGPLPAAVELAAFRIVVEATTNVVRHAKASRCDIRLGRNEATLAIEVVDDGTGLPGDLRPGVGMTSMRERAQELGGTLEITPVSSGGTRVQVRLPVVS